MLGSLGYLGLCFICAGIMMTLHSMARPIQARGESRPWMVLIVCFVICVLVPYAAAEVFTRMYGKNMSTHVDDVMAEIGIEGGTQFYRVIWYYQGKARVIAIGLEKADWGGTDRPVVGISMTKKGNDWEVEDYNVVNSINRNEDSTTLPPYW